MSPKSSHTELSATHTMCYVFYASMALYIPFALKVLSTILVLLGEFTIHFSIIKWNWIFNNQIKLWGPLPSILSIPPLHEHWRAHVRWVPVHDTWHKIPRQFHPASFWTPLTQNRHLMNVCWLQEWMMNKSNLPSWVWPHKICLLKTKFSVVKNHYDAGHHYMRSLVAKLK